MPTETTKNSTVPSSSPGASVPDSPGEAEFDKTLVRRCNDGDPSAFVEIMRRYQGKIFGLTLNLLHNSADAEEVTQDTFIRAHRSLARFRGDCSLSTWLYRIALNLSRNRYWYFFRRRRQDSVSLERELSDGSDATFADLIAAEGNDPVQATVSSEFSEIITACMEKLDQKHREILTMRNILNLPYEEIARTLGINVGTVKSRIARARENLRALLGQAYPEFAPDTAPADYFMPARPVYGRPTIAYA